MEAEDSLIYSGFARVYDLFMDEIPYGQWYQYLSQLLEEEGIAGGTVVDLACGTGEIARRLRGQGYQVIGVDLSQEMLEIASQKCPPDVLLLRQDMRELKLHRQAQGVVCLCDGIIYLLSERDMEQTFAAVFSSLEQGGVFIFDMKTDFFYREVLGNCTLADNRQEASYIWDNEYDGESGVNTYLLTVYELVDDERDLFVRTDELHRQRAYPAERVQALLEGCGFAVDGVYGALTRQSPGADCQRIYFIARKERQ